jgi:hypothetical protein
LFLSYIKYGIHSDNPQYRQLLSSIPFTITNTIQRKTGRESESWIMVCEKLQIVDGEVTLTQSAHTNNVKVTGLISIKRQVLGVNPV